MSKHFVTIIIFFLFLFSLLPKVVSRVASRQSIRSLWPYIQIITYFSTFIFTLSTVVELVVVRSSSSWELKAEMSKKKLRAKWTRDDQNISTHPSDVYVESWKNLISVPPNKRPPRLLICAVHSSSEISSKNSEFQGKSLWVVLLHVYLSIYHISPYEGEWRTRNNQLEDSDKCLSIFLICHNKKIIMFRPFYCI